MCSISPFQSPATDVAATLRRVCRTAGLLAALAVWPSPGLAQSPPPAPPTAEPAKPASTTAEPAKSTQLPAPRPPFPNRANEVMPSWLRVRGEFRERAEGVVNGGFDSGRDDVYYLSRFRFSAVMTGKAVSATIQVHDARVGDKSFAPTGAPFKAAFDLRQAAVDIGSAKAPLAARLGRQEIAFGDQRLVGHANWLNSGRSFDAARVIVRARRAQIDLFAASVVRILDDEFDKSGNGNRFAGAYVTSGALVPEAVVEPYVFWRRDGNLRSESGSFDALHQLTTGARLVGKLPARLDYNIEAAIQRGSLGSDSVGAWAGHWQLRHTLQSKRAPHVIAEYNYASGDANPADGRRGTFDQLYPTAHDKYGLADQVGWRNIHHLRAGFDIALIRLTPIAVSYHSFWLAESRDALYAASGAPIARVPSGAASTRVGQEIDAQISRPITPQLTLAAGYSHLVAGPFLKEATPGKSYSGPFVMATYVFLAEK